jgi:hypothetical protein
MFISVYNNNLNNNLRLDVSIFYDIVNSNEISFTTNIKMFDSNKTPAGPYDYDFVGIYNLKSKELAVSKKSTGIFKNEFYFDGEVLFPNLFGEYILPNINIS